MPKYINSLAPGAVDYSTRQNREIFANPSPVLMRDFDDQRGAKFNSNSKVQNQWRNDNEIEYVIQPKDRRTPFSHEKAIRPPSSNTAKKDDQSLEDNIKLLRNEIQSLKQNYLQANLRAKDYNNPPENEYPFVDNKEKVFSSPSVSIREPETKLPPRTAQDQDKSSRSPIRSIDNEPLINIEVKRGRNDDRLLRVLQEALLRTKHSNLMVEPERIRFSLPLSEKKS
jgi:hypothetical protein